MLNSPLAILRVMTPLKTTHQAGMADILVVTLVSSGFSESVDLKMAKSSLRSASSQPQQWLANPSCHFLPLLISYDPQGICIILHPSLPVWTSPAYATTGPVLSLMTNALPAEGGGIENPRYGADTVDFQFEMDNCDANSTRTTAQSHRQYSALPCPEGAARACYSGVSVTPKDFDGELGLALKIDHSSCHG